MQPVLDGIVLGSLQEQHIGSDAVLRAALWRLKTDLIGFVERAAPA